MRKTIAALLGAALVITLGACSTSSTPGETGAAAGKTIYVLGPTPDHGWTAQAGSYAEKKVAEIN
ncbi:MAG: sugar ABC transporter permease, partial [Phenylobacterium zucineum]